MHATSHRTLATVAIALLSSAMVSNAAEPAIALAPLPNPARPIRIAIYEGVGSVKEGVGHVEAGVKLIPGATIERLAAKDFATRDLSKYDVVVFSAGAASAQAKDIGDAGRKKVRQYVEQGGAYLGICAGAYLACAEFDWGLQLINAHTISDKWQRGEATVEMQLTPEGRKLFGNVEKPLKVRYENGPVIGQLDREGMPRFRTLATYATEIAENDSPVGIMTGSPAMAEAPFGKGRVIIFSPHPENTPGLERMLPLAISRLATSAKPQATKE
jgi:glutamine amidotransferase-like uncharacterized protein